MTTTISNAVSSFSSFSKFTLRGRETNEISGEEGTNSLETLVLILFTGVLLLPDALCHSTMDISFAAAIGIEICGDERRARDGRVDWVPFRDGCDLNFSSPAEGGRYRADIHRRNQICGKTEALGELDVENVIFTVSCNWKYVFNYYQHHYYYQGRRC